jgi:hypothetical protein
VGTGIEHDETERVYTSQFCSISGGILVLLYLCSAFFLLLATYSQKAIFTIKSAKIRSYLKDFQSPCFGQNLRKKLPLFYTWYRVSSPKHIYRDVEHILLSYLATNLIFLSINNTLAMSQN